jgi:D-alanyl-D-alanine carboxypeptidase
VRKFYLFALGFALLIGLPLPVTAGPSVVFDVKTGDVLHADNAGKHWYPASLTKLMTVYVTFKAIDAGTITLETKITVSPLARAQPPSKIGLPVGAKITIKKALEVLIVRSANDIAIVLAEGVGGDLETFMAQMNQAAKQLGMTGSYFANPHGLPDVRQMTTARDMGLLARALIREFPEHNKLFSKPFVKIGRRRLRNRNSILKKMKIADGMKTGFICASGYNLVASATRHGRKIVAVVLGEKSGGVRTQKAHRLLEKGFSAGPEEDYTENSSLGSLMRLANAGWNSTSGNMHKTVCRRTAQIRLTRPSRIKRWGVVFGEYDKARQANAALHIKLLALRNVVYAGDGAIVKNYSNGKLRVIMGSLTEDQVKKTCDMLAGNGEACVILKPGTLKDPPELIAKLKRAKKKRRRVKRKRRKKRPRVVKKTRSTNWAEAKKKGVGAR